MTRPLSHPKRKLRSKTSLFDLYDNQTWPPGRKNTSPVYALYQERRGARLQRDELLASLPFFVREDRAAQALRRLCQAPAHARQRGEARSYHGFAAIRPELTVPIIHPKDGCFVSMRPVETIARERALLNETIRDFLKARGYLEVETPLFVASPDISPNLTHFETVAVEPNGTEYRGALITSPEYSMKKLLGQGLEAIYSLTKVFRNNEEFGGTHNPEFTMLEWYRQGKDYHFGMDETEALVQASLVAFGKSALPKFKRMRVRDLFLQHIGLDLDTATESDQRAACERLGLHPSETDTESDLFYRLFLAKVEPNLGDDPIFVYDYPKHQAALSRLTPDGKYGERFELYVGGLELCNAFTELTDAVEQRQRFECELEERKTLGKTRFPIDEELLKRLPSVRHPTFGNALGVDRLHMLCAGVASIRDVLLFPAADLFKNS